MPYESRPRGDPRTRLYNSAAWRRTREAVLYRDAYSCTICGAPAVSVHHIVDIMLGGAWLDPGNLRSLCTECHGHMNDRGARYTGPPAVTCNRFITTVSSKRPSELTLVAGPPGSGKSTYVQQHAAPDDLVWDYDVEMSRLTGLPMYVRTPKAHASVMAKRQAFVERALASRRRAWLIASAPSQRERDEWAAIGFTVVVLDVESSTCLERIKGRTSCINWRSAIAAWWREFSSDS
jgi:hypothetical protein